MTNQPAIGSAAEQPRKDDGTYTYATKGEPNVEALSLSVYNRPDASFLFPSPSSTAEYCIRFWSTTNIPDGVFKQFFSRRTGSRKTLEGDQDFLETIRDLTEHSLENWLDENSDATEEETDTRRSQLSAETFDRFAGKAMHPSDVPVIARAAMMFHNAPSEDFLEEREAVMDFEVTLVNGRMTVAEIADLYKTEAAYLSLSTEPVNPGDEMMYGAISNLTSILTNFQAEQAEESGNQKQLTKVIGDLNTEMRIANSLTLSTPLPKVNRVSTVESPADQLARLQMADREKAIEHDIRVRERESAERGELRRQEEARRKW